MAIARTASVLPWMRSKPWAVSLINLSLMLLWKCARELTLYLNNVADVGFKLLISFRYYLTWMWFIITLIRTLMDELYLWNLCNVWHVCWIMYDLGCMVMVNRDSSWYSTDYRVYMGSSMKVRSLRGLPLYLCSYKLVGSAIVGIRARFNINCHMCI